MANLKEKLVELLEVDVSNKYYGVISDWIDVLMNSDNTSLFIMGKSAIGKTYNTIEFLKRKSLKYMLIGGNITPLKLYKKLYEAENSDIDIIVLDDLLSILNSEQCLAILYQAFWEEYDKRMVSWSSSSKKLKNYPESFEFTKKCIVLINEIPNRNNIHTLMTRSLVYNLKFSYEEILAIMRDISKLSGLSAPASRTEVVDFIEANTDRSCKHFNLRLQKKIEEIRKAKPKKWKQLSLVLLEKDKSLIRLAELLELCSTVKEAREKWCVETNFTERYFHKLKNRLV